MKHPVKVEMLERDEDEELVIRITQHAEGDYEAILALAQEYWGDQSDKYGAFSVGNNRWNKLERQALELGFQVYLTCCQPGDPWPMLLFVPRCFAHTYDGAQIFVSNMNGEV